MWWQELGVDGASQRRFQVLVLRLDSTSVKLHCLAYLSEEKTQSFDRFISGRLTRVEILNEDKRIFSLGIFST